MARESVKLTIDINQSDLEADKLDELTRNLLQEMKQLDEVEKVSLVADENPPEGSRAFGSFLLGILQAEVSIENIRFVLEFLSNKLSPKPIEIEVEVEGKKVIVKVGSQQQLPVAIDAAIDTLNKLLASAQEDKNG